MKIFNATLITGLSLLSFSAVTSAAVIQSLTLPLSFSHESNPLYSTTNQQSISRNTLTPRYSISSNSGINQWTSSASLKVVRTSDQNISQDRNDPSLNLGWTHNYETGQFSVTGLANDQSTQVSELSDSGLISADNTKKTRTASVNWNNSLTDRMSLSLGGSVSKASYHGTATTGLVNYQSKSSNAKLSYSLSDQTEVFTQLAYSLYKPEDNNSAESNTKSISLGLTWTISDKINTSISAGTNKTENANTSTQRWQASISSNYATPLTNTQLSLSRSQAPSSTGSFNESQQLALGWSYSLTERDNIALNISWRENLSANKTQTNQFSASYTKALSLSWDFRLSASHNAREDKLTNVSSRSIMASITYNLPGF